MIREIADRADLNAESGEDAHLVFAEIHHPLLAEPLRVVADLFKYTWRGALWSDVLFEFEILSDTEDAPEARLILPVIDQRVAEVLIALPSPARISVWVLTSADFDLTEDPRVPLSQPVPLIEMLNLTLSDVQGTTSSASGRLTLRDYAREPWPSVRATQSRCPGLFV